MANVTGSQLIAEVRKLAAEQPDFVYGGQEETAGNCSYFGCAVGNNSGRACIIGQALKNLNVNTTLLREFEEEYTSSKRFAEVVSSELITLSDASDEQLGWLDLVQSYQDVKYPWSVAVAESDHRMGVLF